MRWLDINYEDVVLDIGSGNHPNLRANILCDKFVYDSSERACHSPISIDQRPFIIGDGECLPFKDKSFDYVICSHILEHVENPSIFLQEIQRVGKRGYIETPHPIYEKMIGGTPFHKSFVWNIGGKLVIEKKSKGIIDSDLRAFFNSVLVSGNIFGELLVSNLRNLGFLTQYKWESEIKYMIKKNENVQDNQIDGDPFIRAKLDGTKASFEIEPEIRVNMFRRKIKQLLGQWFRRYSDRKCCSPESLLNILACPICKADLTFPDQNKLNLICSYCHQEYTATQNLGRGYMINLLPISERA